MKINPTTVSSTVRCWVKIATCDVRQPPKPPLELWISMEVLTCLTVVFYVQVINTFTEAVQTVDMEKAVGKPHTIWVQFAKFYEEHEQLQEVSLCLFE